MAVWYCLVIVGRATYMTRLRMLPRIAQLSSHLFSESEIPRNGPRRTHFKLLLVRIHLL